MKLIYNIGICFYSAGIYLASLFSRKVSLFVSGRKGIIKRITKELSDKRKGRKLVWFHCASVGEFEQARPLIEKLKREDDGYYIFLTFFSPSGYELIKEYKFADSVFYLPLDSSGNARRFIRAVAPDVAIFVKYEFWCNYLACLKREGVPTYLISAIFRKSQSFFKWHGGLFMRRALKTFTTFFVQNEESGKLLDGIGLHNYIIAGDTRCDRVNDISKNADFSDRTIETFKGDFPLWVAGSTWNEDEKIIAGCYKEISGIKLIVVPHETDDMRIKSVEDNFSDFRTVKYSDFVSKESGRDDLASCSNAQILIIDRIGFLSMIYRYALFAYIGGGFHTGIHNILEASTYGCPVVFGPKYRKFQEAKDLISLGGAVSVSDAAQLKSVISPWLSDSRLYEKASEVSRRYVESNTGATDVILKNIFPDNI